jgi:hypothetical protein
LVLLCLAETIPPRTGAEYSRKVLNGFDFSTEYTRFTSSQANCIVRCCLLAETLREVNRACSKRAHAPQKGTVVHVIVRNSALTSGRAWILLLPLPLFAESGVALGYVGFIAIRIDERIRRAGLHLFVFRFQSEIGAMRA